jgi:hypothetical protein
MPAERARLAGLACDAASLGNGDWQVTFRRPS